MTDADHIRRLRESGAHHETSSRVSPRPHAADRAPDSCCCCGEKIQFGSWFSHTERGIVCPACAERHVQNTAMSRTLKVILVALAIYALVLLWAVV